MTYGHVRRITVMFNSCLGRNNSVHHTEFDVHSNELFLNLRKKIETQWQEFQREDCSLELSKGNDMIVDEKDNYKTLEQLEIANRLVIYKNSPSLIEKFSSVLHARMISIFSNTLPYSKLEKHEEIGNSLRIN